MVLIFLKAIIAAFYNQYLSIILPKKKSMIFSNKTCNHSNVNPEQFGHVMH